MNFLFYLPFSNVGLIAPGTYNLNAQGRDACRESDRLWIRTLDRNTMEGLRACVLITKSGPPPETTQDRHPVPGYKFKCLSPPGIEPGPQGWKAGILPTTTRRRINSEFITYKIFPDIDNVLLYQHHHHQSVLPKGRSFTANAET